MPEPDPIFGEAPGHSPQPGEPRDRPAIARPIVFATLAFMGGLALGREVIVPAWCLIVPAALAVVALFGEQWRVRGAPASAISPAGYLFFPLLFILGWAESNQAIRIDRRAEAIAIAFEPYEVVQIEGRIAEPPGLGNESMVLVLDHPRLSTAPRPDLPSSFPLMVMATVKLNEGDASSLPLQGSRVRLWGRVRVPESAGHQTDFDRRNLMLSRGIGAIFHAASAKDMELLPSSATPSAALLSSLDRLRRTMRSQLDSVLSPSHSALAAALLLGDRRGLSPQLAEDFTKTGLAHILSVSGLHTGFVLIIILFLARMMMVPIRGCAVVGIGALIAYTTLTGFQPPVVRAAIMGCFLMGAWGLGRTASTLAALAASALFTLVLDARNLVRVDWILSYLCIASIIILAPPLTAMFSTNDEEEESKKSRLALTIRRYSRILIFGPLVTTLAISIGLLPVQLALFQRISWVAFPANLLGAVISFFIVALTMFITLLGWIPFVGSLIALALASLLTFFESFVSLMARLPGASLNVPPMPLLLLTLYYTFLLYGPHLREGEGPKREASRRQKLHTMYRVLACTLVILIMPFFARAFEGGFLDLYVLDVGQGDALVLRFPDGKVGVVDGGLRHGGDRGRQTVAPFLRALGVSRIDFAVASHADADHIGGLVYLVENFTIGRFLQGQDASDSALFAELQKTIRDHRVPSRPIRAGDAIEGLGPVEVTVLNPTPDEDNNDASVVLLVDFNEIEMLLTGDIETPAERRIIEGGRARDIEVLKVAHHGSRTSSSEAFLDAFTPEVALISAGRGNSYGHPSADVISRLNAHGITIARTDELGTLRVRTDGHNVALFRYKTADPR